MELNHAVRETPHKTLKVDSMNMNTNTITCPKCKAEIPLTDAVTHGIREQLETEFQTRQRELQQALENREETLQAQLKQVEQDRKSIADEVGKRLETERKKLLATAREEAARETSMDMQGLKERLAERELRLAEFRQNELELRKREQELKDRADELELELVKKLNAEREKIRKDAASAAMESERLKLAEKESVITGLQDQIARLKQQAEQGSMQLQGEVLELELETQLSAAFPHDEIAPVGKGQKGGDIVQRVRTNMGHECGIILWEAKRTRNWSGVWTGKLKDDMRAARAEMAVLVSQALPDGVKHFGQVDGLWVCDYASVPGLAAALRCGIVSTAMARLAETGRIGKTEEVYAYLCSAEFRQRVEAMVESFTAMQKDLHRERRAMEKSWAAREKQIMRGIQHTAQLYGSIQGIMGHAVLPEIKTLSLGEGSEPAETGI
jgi:hypothetical protein